jgi:RNase P subunit RPR2
VTIQARPTIYAGVQMRSRLEAAYAESRDRKGVEWEYEPNAFASVDGQYLPDFKIANGYVEIKPPNADFAAALTRMHIVLASEQDASLFVVTRESQYDDFRIAKECRARRGCGSCDRPMSGALHETVDHRSTTFVSSHTYFKCPRCENSTTHLVDVMTQPMAGRLSTELVFVCECCDFLTRWSITNHKGATQANWWAYQIDEQRHEELMNKAFFSQEEENAFYDEGEQAAPTT